MRNIDKIREMDSEELVEFIMQSYINDKCEACIYNPSECKGKCREGMEKWFDAIDLETELTSRENKILDLLKEDSMYILKQKELIVGLRIQEDEDGYEEECVVLEIGGDFESFNWLEEDKKYDIAELLKIKQVEKTIEEKNIETNETLYNLIDTCRKKLAGLYMMKENSTGRERFRPIKNTRGQEVYKAIYELMHIFKPSISYTTYQVMENLQSGEIHKKQ